jgi:hypothetical protein
MAPRFLSDRIDAALATHRRHPRAKRVEDARERAFDPRVHLLRNKLFAKKMDCRVAR